MKGTINMSIKEVNRLAILDKLLKKEMKQNKAAKILGVSTRQVRRLIKKYRKGGPSGLIHGLRGIPGNHRLDEKEIDQALSFVKEKYYDFGPTFALEKLVENHGVKFSRETLRKAMILEGVWIPKQRKEITLHQLRERRSMEGELVQVDGSPHDWFEGRGTVGKCTLLVFIDDATGKLLHLELAPSESLNAYLLAAKHYITLHGKPAALYVDRHGVFRVNTRKGGSAGVEDSNGVTQFGRAMEELSIQMIFAYSAEAKGRVEKVNQTLQDRLTKELRLKRINSMEEANRYLPEFIKDFNQKFAVVPKSPVNLHRPLRKEENLDLVLCQKHKRVLSKQLTLSYQNKQYQIKTQRPVYAMRHAPVEVREDSEGRITIWYHSQSLDYEIINQRPKAQIVDSKQLNLVVDQVVTKAWIPSENHPWRRRYLTS